MWYGLDSKIECLYGGAAAARSASQGSKAGSTAAPGVYSSPSPGYRAVNNAAAGIAYSPSPAQVSTRRTPLYPLKLYHHASRTSGWEAVGPHLAGGLLNHHKSGANSG